MSMLAGGASAQASAKGAAEVSNNAINSLVRFIIILLESVAQLDLIVAAVDIQAARLHVRALIFLAHRVGHVEGVERNLVTTVKGIAGRHVQLAARLDRTRRAVEGAAGRQVVIVAVVVDGAHTPG